MINWHNRYAKLLQRNAGLFDPSFSVLEVGSGLHGIALWLQRPVVGLEPDWAGTPNPLIEPITGDILHLPFTADSFDYVVCIDVLERLPGSARRAALEELMRVCRQKVLLACACGDTALQGELAFAGLLRALDMPLPGWLREHFDLGLPELGQVVQALLDADYPFELMGNENRLQHYAGLLLDTTLPLATDWNVLHAAKTVLEPPVGDASWDEYYSYLFEVDKRQRKRRAAGPSLPGFNEAHGHESTFAMYAVAHDASVKEDIAPLTYIWAGEAAEAPTPVQAIAPLVDAGYLDNSRWSELSAMYSVWKNGPVTDVVGFCHYRRFFNFGADAGAKRQETIERQTINAVKANFFCPDLVPRIEQGLVVVAEPADLGMTVFEHYCHYHNTSDYLTMFNIVSESSPEVLPFLAEDFASTRMYCNNMFIMNWGLFDCLCSTWFPVLQEFCLRVEAGRAQTYQNRDVGFLSERLFSAWIKYAMSRGVQTLEQPVYFVGSEVDTAPSDNAGSAIASPQPGITVGDRLRAASSALEAEREKSTGLLAGLDAERVRAGALLEAVRADQARSQDLTDELATMRASEAWQLSQRLRRSPLVREAYRTARSLQRRLRRF